MEKLGMVEHSTDIDLLGNSVMAKNASAWTGS